MPVEQAKGEEFPKKDLGCWTVYCGWKPASEAVQLSDGVEGEEADAHGWTIYLEGL